jgi:hypothetical protein
MAAKLFGSIEGRHGVHEPDYQPPADEPVRVSPETDSHRIRPLEAIVAFVFPLIGLGLSIWRFVGATWVPESPT